MDTEERNYNIEDTGALMLEQQARVRRKGLILLVVAIVAVAVVAAVVGIKVVGDKRYDDQVAIAEKALKEGNYEQAETEYLAAVKMNKRKVKAREGLAYTYAVEEKFEESTDLYQGLYDETKNEIYKVAADETASGMIPSVDEVVPVENLWLEVPVDRMPDPEDFLQFMSAYLEYYSFYSIVDKGKTGDSFKDWYYNNEKPEQSYSILIAEKLLYEYDYFEYKGTREDTADRDEDPRGWYDLGYIQIDKATLDRALIELFNTREEDIESAVKTAEKSQLMYLDGDYYYIIIYPTDFNSLNASPVEIWKNGSKYCIHYKVIMTAMGSNDTSDIGDYYAVMRRKDVNGQPRWTMIYNGVDMPSEVKEGIPSKEGSADTTDNAAVYNAYAQVLRENESGIKGYWWQLDNRGEYYNEYDYDTGSVAGDVTNPCVAVNDLNGDSIPELLFMKKSAEYEGQLHIYTYSGGKAVECSYSITNYGGEKGPFSDVHVAAGTVYMIYTGKEESVFYIAHGMGDESYTDTICEFVMDKNGSISQKNCIQHKTEPNEDYSGTLETYTFNDSEVSKEKGSGEMSRMLQAYNSLIMSSYRHDEYAEFRNTGNEKAAAMSYDEAIKKLTEV